MRNWKPMIASSQHPDAAFSGVKWRQVRALISIIEGATLTRKDYIKRRYEEQEPNFFETLEFLKALHVIKESNNDVVISQSELVTYAQGPIGWVVSKLAAGDGPHSSQFRSYLREFNVAHGEVIGHPAANTRHTLSHVRNFLMELGIVCHDWVLDVYKIAPEYFGLYVCIRDSEKEIPPSLCASMPGRRETLGLAAEEAVLAYERKRLGKTYEDRVLHVASKNVSAGYDIRSITLTDRGKGIPRCIEVKAVPRDTLRFFWTRNERHVAKTLADWYWLYLLPVDGRGSLLIEELVTIQNAWVNVLDNPETWEIDPDVVICHIREKGED